jgi:hypothetical protein
MPMDAVACYTVAARAGQRWSRCAPAVMHDEVEVGNMRRTPQRSRLFRRGDVASCLKGTRYKALFGAIVLMGALALSGLGALWAPHALADDAPQIQIVVPSPSNGVAQGPVGAKVSITAQIPDAAGDSFQIGWAPQSGSCSDDFKSVDGVVVTADGSGNLSATFPWPGSANSTGASYFVCAADVSHPEIGALQSAQQYLVAAASRPSITVAGQSSTGVKGIFAGGTVQINGSRFLPSNTRLYVFLNDEQGFDASDLQLDQALPTTDGSNITSADDGGFTATVKLPSAATGARFLHVVSADGQQNFPPALVATRQIQIAQAPTPVPSPSPTSSAGTGGGQPGSNGAMPAIIGLGALSVVLFILGVILIASVASSPRPSGGGGRPEAGW